MTRALGWAATMLLVAAGAATGLMDRDAAVTVLIVLPLLAVVSLRGPDSCRMWRAK